MAKIVRLKTNRDQKISELLEMFNLPHHAEPNKPRPNLVGGSATAAAAMNPTEAARLNAVNELFKLNKRIFG